jgi:hypothetical protein
VASRPLDSKRVAGCRKDFLILIDENALDVGGTDIDA